MSVFDRSKALGASEAAGALGLDPYQSPTDVWMDKTGQGREVTPNLAMRIGTLLEEPVARLYAEQTGRQVQRHRRACAPCTRDGLEYTCYDSAAWDPDYDFLFAHLDRITRDRKGEPWEVLEIKTSGWPGDDWGPSGSEQIPTRVGVQVALQMRIAGLSTANVAALLWGRELRTYRIQRDENLELQLLDELTRFWRLVQIGEPPVHPDHPATGKALLRLYPSEEGEPLAVPAGAADWELVQEVATAYQQWKAAGNVYDEAKVRMQARLGTLPGFEWDEGKITWREVRSKRTDWERVAQWIGSLAVEQGVVPEQEWRQFVEDSTETASTRRFLVSMKRGNGK